MAELKSAGRGFARATACVLAVLVAACAADSTEPAPVFLRGAEPAVSIGSAALRGEARQIVVRPGQSLRGIAHAYHVPPSAIVAANHLTPPYKVAIGQRLLIPAGGAMPIRQAA